MLQDLLTVSKDQGVVLGVSPAPAVEVGWPRLPGWGLEGGKECSGSSPSRTISGNCTPTSGRKGGGGNADRG